MAQPGYSDADVLLSNTRIHTQHTGNLRLKEIETNRLAEYEAAPRILEYGEEGKSKKDINREILHSIKENGGRFLRKNRTTGLWEAVSDQNAVGKILRDFAALRKSLAAEETRTSAATHQPQVAPVVISNVVIADKVKENCDDGIRETNDCIPQPSKIDKEHEKAPVDKAAPSDHLAPLPSDAILDLREPNGSNRDSSNAQTEPRREEATDNRTRQRLERQHDLDLVTEISIASPEVTEEIEMKLGKLKENAEYESVAERLVSELADRATTPENGNVMAVAGGYESSGRDILIEAMKRYPSNKKMQDCGNFVLAHLAQKDNAATSETENLNEIGGSHAPEVSENKPTNTSRARPAGLRQAGCAKFGLCDSDFPIGAKSSHPGRVALFADIDACLDEYLLADVASSRTTPEGSFLRSKKRIVAHLLELLYDRGGRVKQKQKDGRWIPIQCENVDCSGCRACEKLHTKIRDQIKARVRKLHGGGNVRTVVAAHLEDTTGALRDRNTDEPSVLSVNVTDASVFSLEDVSLLYSLAGITARDDWMSVGTKQGQLASSLPVSAANGIATTTSVGGEPMSLMSISESGDDQVVSQLPPCPIAPDSPSSDRSFLPFNVVVDGDDESSRGSTNTIENVTDNLSRMHEHRDDVNLVEEIIDALAGEMSMYYGGDGLEKEVELGYHASKGRRRSREVSAVNAESVTLLLDTVQAYPENLSIQRNCCLILHNLALSRDNLGAISGAGCSWLVRAMTRAPAGNEEIQRLGINALGNLALNESNRTAIGSCGGVSVLFGAMRNFPSEEQLQRCACQALANLTKGKKGEIREMIRLEGGVKMLVAAMKGFPDSSEIQHGCLLAFGNLAKDEVGRAAVSEAGGIRQTVVALNQFAETTQEDLQGSGCRALGYLSMAADSGGAIVDCSGVERVANAMQTFDTNEEIARYGCLAFFNITRDCLEKVKASGLVDPMRRAVLAALGRFPSSRHVRKHSRKALVNMSSLFPGGFSS